MPLEHLGLDHHCYSVTLPCTFVLSLCLHPWPVAVTYPGLGKTKKKALIQLTVLETGERGHQLSFREALVADSITGMDRHVGERMEGEKWERPGEARLVPLQGLMQGQSPC